MSRRQSVRVFKRKRSLNVAQAVDDQKPDRETKDSLVKPHQEMLTENVPHSLTNTPSHADLYL